MVVLGTWPPFSLAVESIQHQGDMLTKRCC